MRALPRAASLLLLAAGWALAADAPEPPEVPPAEFARLFEDLRPARDEGAWREIPWLTSVRAARERAVAEDKPILILTAADGCPIGRT
jgi:hypothetical protein